MYFSKESNQTELNINLSKYENNLEEIPKIKNIKKNTYLGTTSKKEVKNRFFINIESNIFNDKNYIHKKNNQKKFNLRNYKKIINNNIGNNFASFEEQNEVNFINIFFDSLKSRKLKKEFLKNKTHYKNILAPIDKKNDNNNNANLEGIKIVRLSDNLNKRKNPSLPKKEINYYNINDFKKEKLNIIKDISNSFKNKNNKEKLKKNKTHKTEFPNIKIMKNNLENLFLKVDELNNNFEKAKKKNLIENQDIQKINNTNIVPPIKSNEQSNIIYNDEINKNFLKNKKIFDKYIEKFTIYKYKNKAVNRFFRKRELSNNNINIMLPNNKEKEEDLFRKKQKSYIIQNKLINEIKELKNRVKSNVDKDIFKMFNKNT